MILESEEANRNQLLRGGMLSKDRWYTARFIARQ